MLFQGTLFRKSVVTNFTFEWLNSFMNWCNMLIQVTLLDKGVVTKFAFEWLLSFMDYLMLIQVTLSREFILTYTTLEWLDFFMNWCNMLFQVTHLRRSVVMSHLNDFFLSWTDATCWFKPLSISHFKDFSMLVSILQKKSYFLQRITKVVYRPGCWWRLNVVINGI